MTKEEAISIMKVIVHMLEEKYDTDRVEEAVDMAIEALQQEPKTGHWIDTGSGQECSVCGEIQYGYDSYRCFCANCGAKMVEPQEGGDQE